MTAFAVRVGQGIGKQRRRGDRNRSSAVHAATRLGGAMLLASGMKISAEPKPEKPARDAGDHRDDADRGDRANADVG